MGGLRGNPESLQSFKKRLKGMPITLAQNVAREAAPALTSMALQAYDSGQSVYGEARPPGVDGNKLSLVRTEDTKKSVRFVAIGTLVRCVLGTRHARFLIGKYGILPNGAIPFAWGQRLQEIVQEQGGKL